MRSSAGDKVKPSFGRTGPGKRGRAASTSDATKWIIFGGLRQWQGFAPANDISNFWSDTTAYPIGGYLDDLWIYTLSPAGPASLFGARNTGLGTTLFQGAHPTDYTTGRWNRTKPRDRLSGNEATGTRDLLLGEPVSAGLGAWAQVLPREACYSYPGAAYTARSDILCSITWPQARADAALALFGELLFVHGGYSCPFPYPHVKGRGSGPGVASLASDSQAPYPSYPYYLDDLWHFDFVSGTWLRVTPASPARPSGRMGHSIVLAGAALLLVGGYAENFFNSDLWIYNLTTNRWLQKTYYTHALLPESCTDDTAPDPDPGRAPGSLIAVSQSVAGEPTRGTVLDGLFGRASAPVLVPQARRAAPGWDGCVSRQDARPDLPATLQWEQPSQRAFHRAVFSEKFDLMLLYGGETLYREQVETRALTWPTQADGQLWMWNRWACPSNCSLHGDCWYGHCYCYDGYYGIDCSNSSCPGTYCHYDTTQHLQVCQHCCSATYVHTDADVYVENRRKVPCDAEHSGLSHGICDGESGGAGGARGACGACGAWRGADCGAPLRLLASKRRGPLPRPHAAPLPSRPLRSPPRLLARSLPPRRLRPVPVRAALLDGRLLRARLPEQLQRRRRLLRRVPGEPLHVHAARNGQRLLQVRLRQQLLLPERRVQHDERTLQLREHQEPLQ